MASTANNRKLRKFTKYRDVMSEINRKGAAIYSEKEYGDQLVINFPYSVNYIHSYANDSRFFLGLAEGKLFGSRCARCDYVFATPRSHCMFCGEETRWKVLPRKGKVHSWTTCEFGSEAFLKETPYNLALIEFAGVNSLFMTRLKDCVREDIYVGMPVEARFARKPEYLVRDVWFVPSVPPAKKKKR